LRRHHPEVSLPILNEVVDVIPGQSVGLVVVVDGIAMDAVNPAIVGADPQRTLAIRVKPRHHHGTAVERRSIEGLPPSVEESLEAKTGA